MHSHKSSFLAVLLCLLFVQPSLATDYLIVTSDALASAFQALASQKAQQGYTTQILTVEDIQSAATPGRDLAEQIRNAIEDVHAQGSLRFVVLGGDTDVIPVRYAENAFYPQDGPIPTDLYYAALDGNWDADGDDLFAEVGVDATDLEPDVAVGRIPVSSAAQATSYASKVAQYEDPANDAHLTSALLLDEVLFPASWTPGDLIQLDGAVYGEQMAGILQSATPALLSDRSYENYLDFPGSNQLTKAQALAALDSGDHGLVVHVGHGYTTSMSVGDDAIESADMLGLTNGPHYFVLASQISYGAALDEASILEELLRNPDGGAVASLGATRTSFPQTTQSIINGIHEELLLEGMPSLGEALNTVRSDLAPSATTNSAERHALLAINLLGDPELTVGPDASAELTSTPSAQSARVALRSIVPNPFNPSVSIRFELAGGEGNAPHTSVILFDLAGRRVRTLWNAPLGIGPHELSWDGRDDAGASLASGSYFVSIESGGDRQSGKMVLLK